MFIWYSRAESFFHRIDGLHIDREAARMLIDALIITTKRSSGFCRMTVFAAGQIAPLRICPKGKAAVGEWKRLCCAPVY